MSKTYIKDTAEFKAAQGKGFFAARSDEKHPFVGPKEEAPPGYHLSKGSNGTNWCIRRGEVEVPWGISADVAGYAASGCIRLLRAEVDGTVLEGLNLPFVTAGDASYLYDMEFAGNGFRGYAVYLRDELLPLIRMAARTRGEEEFREFMQSTATVLEDGMEKERKGLASVSEVHRIMERHCLTVVSVAVDAPFTKNQTNQ